jgi:phosphinothricin acetyltransferase
LKIRTAKKNDWQQIVEIYNQAVAEGFRTADIVPITIEERLDWLDQHDSNSYPIYVCEIDQRIIGWCSLSPYRKGREALRTSAEISYYVDKKYREQGVASNLIEYSITRAPKIGLRNLFAILLDVNKVSIRLLEKYGFEKWGHLPEIADFNGTICGQFIYGRKV